MHSKMAQTGLSRSFAYAWATAAPCIKESSIFLSGSQPNCCSLSYMPLTKLFAAIFKRSAQDASRSAAAILRLVIAQSK